ncbi:PilZ domain-containing protein [Desulforhopalus sp. 52FAK]
MDQRQIDRKSLVFYLRVFDGLSNKILGHLIDISEKGVLLRTDEPVQPNENHRLRIRLPAVIRERHEVVLNGTSRWCRQDVVQGHYLAGFQVYDVDASTKRVVQKLIVDLGYQEAAS